MTENLRAEIIPRTKKSKILDQAKTEVEEIKRKNQEGNLIVSCWVDNQFNPERLEIKKYEDENGVSYIYTAYNANDDDPYFYAESPILLPAFERDINDSREKPYISLKNNNYTRFDGSPIGTYYGAQSYILRNLTGLFKIYVNENSCEEYSIMLNSSKTSNYEVDTINQRSQQLDPITVMTAMFNENEVAVVAQATSKIDEQTGKQKIKTSCTYIEEDGTINYEKLFKIVRNSLRNNALLGGPVFTDETVRDILIDRAKTAALLFPEVYDYYELPRPTTETKQLDDGNTENDKPHAPNHMRH